MAEKRYSLSTQVGLLNFGQFCAEGLARKRTRDEMDGEIDPRVARPTRGVGWVHQSIHEYELEGS